VLKAEVPLRLLLLHDTHDLRLAEDGTGRVKFTELSHLQHNLLVEVLELLAWQLELRDLGKHSVPAPSIDVGDEGVDAVDSVEGDLALVLQRLERLLQRVLLAELQHYLNHAAHNNNRKSIALRSFVDLKPLVLRKSGGARIDSIIRRVIPKIKFYELLRHCKAVISRGRTDSGNKLKHPSRV